MWPRDYYSSFDPEYHPEVLQPRSGGHPIRLRTTIARCVDFPHRTAKYAARELQVHTHDVYHVVLYVRGEGRCHFRDEPCPVSRGTLFFVEPWEPHAFGTAGPDAFSIITYTFVSEGRSPGQPLSARDLMSSLTGLPLTDVRYPVQLSEGATQSLESSMLRTLTRLGRRDTFAWFAEQCLLADLFRILAEEVYQPVERDSASGAPASLLQVRDLLASRYERDWTLDELAGRSGFSRVYFCRRFRREFGLPPIAYMHQARIGAAKSLLQEVNLSVTDVAERVGYADIYTFCKSFKRHTGMTPTQFRNQTAPT